MTQHIFLSPHLDDVPLSCGGTLAQLVNEEIPVIVITIFAGVLPPDAPVSAFAGYQHQMWGDPQQAYQTRRVEDATALAYFGLKPIWLNFLDCIYRGQPDQGIWYYNSDDDIFGPLHEAEFDTVAPIIEQIKRVISAPEDHHQILIYAPLTVGNHVDHQLVYLAALHLLLEGYPVYFYEEFPYADRDPANLSKALNETTPALMGRMPHLVDRLTLREADPLWQNAIKSFSSAALARKIDAIAAYETQLDVLFGGKAAMTQRVKAYAEQVGQGELAERYWILNL